ncbi:MAG: hypothetical protein C4307_00565 [Chloroflexota bacterium]
MTGLANATLGNLPELFVVLFSLAAGEVVVAQTSILGSVFANALLILGLAIAAGSWQAHDRVMRFSPRLPNDAAILLLVAVFVIVLLGLSDRLGDRASRHQVEISVGAIALQPLHRRVELGHARPPLPPLRRAAHLRCQPPLHRRPGGDGHRPVADHRRRQGAGLRGIGRSWPCT